MGVPFILLALRVPVAFAMFVVGFVGICGAQQFERGDGAAGLGEFHASPRSPELVVVPLFILMGNVATETGMSRRLYDAAYADHRLRCAAAWPRRR